jgi:aminopeptidase
MKQSYTPSDKVLKKYADVLINYGLNNGKGINRGDTVFLILPEFAKPLLKHLENAIYLNDGNLILRYLPSDWARSFEVGLNFFRNKPSSTQLNFYPKNYIDGLYEDIDHYLAILGEENPTHFKSVEPSMINAKKNAWSGYFTKRIAKEDAGELSWSFALYGTNGMAKEADLPLKSYWDQIIKACYLDKDNPVKEWQKAYANLKKTEKTLTDLKIRKVSVKGNDIDLVIGFLDQYKWEAGTGSNIPSFETFTSPKWQSVSGWIKFNMPLYRSGNRVEGIELWFEKGKVVKFRVKKGKRFFENLLKTKNMDKVGEFSLTDKRLSRINKFMAETLYDENYGGKYGNTHIALGAAFRSLYTGKDKPEGDSEWQKLGLNTSPDHVDMFSTSDRTVTATLQDGTEQIIYQDGQFTI